MATLLGFGDKVMDLLRNAGLNEHNLELAAERAKLVVNNVTAELRQTQQMNLTGRLDAAYEEIERYVAELSASQKGDEDA